MEAAKRHAIYLKCNPISHLFISWHSSSDEMVSQYINILEINFNLMFSVVVMAVASAITAIVSMIYIKKVDLIIMLGREEIRLMKLTVVNLCKKLKIELFLIILILISKVVMYMVL